MANLIDKRKMLLFGRLCQLDTKFRIKQVFVHRLTSFMIFPRKTKGFLPDIYMILGKYNLTSFLIIFYSTGVFPNLSTWKRMVKSTINSSIEFDWKNRVLCDKSLNQFLLVHPVFEPCILWHFSRSYRNLHAECTSTFILICRYFSRKYDMRCKSCNLMTNDICIVLSLRAKLWVTLSKLMGIETCRSLKCFLVLHLFI
jgi:hypothetical protein